MRTRMWTSTLAAVAVGALGFGGWSWAQGADHPYAAEIEEARATWAAAGVDDYTITVELHCYCTWPEVTATVVDGRIVAATDDDGAPVEAYQAARVATVEALLETAEEASDYGSLAGFEADPALGVPTLIEFEAEDGVDDTGGHYVVRITR
jgi:hypothetical protein